MYPSAYILDDRSEPELDACVVRDSPRDLAAAHPTRPGLIVEVAQPLGQHEHTLAHRDEGNHFVHEVGCRMPG